MNPWESAGTIWFLIKVHQEIWKMTDWFQALSSCGQVASIILDNITKETEVSS